MFENLTARLSRTFRDLAGYGKLTPENIEPALREIRVALLEADVHFKVVKDFLDHVRVRALGREVLESITPADQFVKIVHDELVATLGGGEASPVLNAAATPPTRILLCGLQGSGKTTAAAKLARLYGDAALVALDLKRPAAIEQLRVLAEQVPARFVPPAHADDAARSARAALAQVEGARHVLFDTAGRLQVDEELMTELAAVAEAVEPHETVLVLDAMTGQEAVKVARAFHERVKLTSLLLTKTDGDARGGAALSARQVTGVPIKWVGTGERIDAIEAFHPDRFAQRILGMGDIVSLVERAARVTDQAQAEKLAKEMMAGKLDLEMFLQQLREMKKMGPLSELLGMLPGGQAMASMAAPSEKEMAHFEAMILSMTPQERRNPDSIDNSRRKRIAAGSGTKAEDVNRMLKRFRQAREVFGALSGGAGRGGGKARGLRKMLGI